MPRAIYVTDASPVDTLAAIIEEAAKQPIEEMYGDATVAALAASVEDLARRLDERLAESGYFWTPGDDVTASG